MRVWPQQAADRGFIFITVYAPTSSEAVTGGAGYAVCAAGLPRRLWGGRKIRRLGDERPADQIRISKNNEIKMWTPGVQAAYHESMSMRAGDI